MNIYKQNKKTRCNCIGFFFVKYLIEQKPVRKLKSSTFGSFFVKNIAVLIVFNDKNRLQGVFNISKLTLKTARSYLHYLYSHKHKEENC